MIELNHEILLIISPEPNLWPRNVQKIDRCVYLVAPIDQRLTMAFMYHWAYL